MHDPSSAPAPCLAASESPGPARSRLTLGQRLAFTSAVWLLQAAAFVTSWALRAGPHPLLRALGQLQAGQAAHLRRLMQIDGLTGVALRPRFLRRLQQRLDDPAGRRAALLLVRLPELDILNLRCGRDSTDRLLQAVAAVLLTYEDRVPGSFAGRLNGSEFALCLPVCGVARETATSLYEALAALPGVRNTGATVLIGGIDGLPSEGTGAALAAAGAAFASRA